MSRGSHKQVKFAEKLVQPSQSKDSMNLLCPRCKKRFVSPLLLPCLHTVCKACLDDERVRIKNGKIARCPTCSEPINLRTDFPVNFVLNNMANEAVLEGNQSQFLVRCDSCDSEEERVTMRCDECFLFLCNFCATAHRRMSATKTHKISTFQELRGKSVNSFTRPCFCATHSKKQIIYYCQSCQVAVCRECILSKHKEHDLMRPEIAYNELKFQIIALTDEVQDKQKNIQKALSSLQEAISKIEKHSYKVRGAIEEYFENLLMAVRKRIKVILKELDVKTGKKLSKLKEQKLKLEIAKGGAQNCCSFSESAVVRGTEVELINVSHAILQKLTQLRKEEITLPRLNVVENHENLTFRAEDGDLIDMINNIGDLDDTCPATDPSLSILDVSALQVTVKEVSRFCVTAVNSRNLRQTNGGDSVTVELCLPQTQTNVDNVGFKYNVRDHGNGQYAIAFLVNKPDIYSLHVNLNGHPLQGSPLSVTVTPKDWIGSVYILSGEKCGGFASPHSVLIDSCDNIIIADSHHHKIKTLDSAGNVTRTIGDQGVRDMQFNFPYCIALNQSSSLLAISDSQNNRIQLIDNTSGKFRKSIGSFGSDDGMFNHPHGIAIDEDDSIIVADSGNSRLQVFSTGGQLLRKLSSHYLSRPWGVALTRGGLIAVTDYNNHKVLVFDRDGTLKYQFGSRGGGDGELNNPAGIAVDADDQFIVADRSNHRVQIFQRDGTYVTKFGGKGTGDGLMRFPAGVAVDKTGHLYVADTMNNRVQVFSLTAV